MRDLSRRGILAGAAGAFAGLGFAPRMAEESEIMAMAPEKSGLIFNGSARLRPNLFSKSTAATAITADILAIGGNVTPATFTLGVV
jgi:hypothetical protein